MMRQFTQIKSYDPYMIHGTLYHKDMAPQEKLIINIHGLTHNQYGYLQLNSIPHFHAKSYDVFNFSFYDRAPSSRRLSETTIETQLHDLERVIAHFKERYDKVYLTAHSLGALITLILNPKNIEAVSLWDPAFDVAHFWEVTKSLTYMPEYKTYKLDYGNEFIIDEQLVESIKEYPHAKCLEISSQFRSPAQIVIPELSIFAASPHISLKEYDSAFKKGYERIELSDTDHCFYGTAKDVELFEHTIKWFDLY